jgi:Fanconi anemia group M protein
LIKNSEFNKSFIYLNELLARKIENPKIKKLKELVEEELNKNEKSKIIIFSQYRDNASKICKDLNLIEKVKAKVFVGQAKKETKRTGEYTGLNQKEQQEIIQEFSEGKINMIVATSIGEEGLDIPEVNAVIFYEPVPSAIRKIQRAGRTARLMPGKLIILMVKDTRDEAYHWSAFHKEKKMYKSINNIKEDLENKRYLKEESQKKLFQDGIS